MTRYLAMQIVEGLIDAESDEQVLEAWQYLVDTGAVWGMPGWYGRTASDLIDAGLIQYVENGFELPRF